MEFNRQIGGRVCFILLVLGNTATVVALTGGHITTSTSLDCTNDYEKHMFCQIDAQNCSEYNLTLVREEGYGKKWNSCTFHRCDTGCCCSVQMILVNGEIQTATVWKEGQSIESKTIDVTSSIKPKTPTIVSVTESNGNFQLRWKTNAEGYIRTKLAANVTYHKKGDTKKESEFVPQTTVDGLNYYEIPGRHLEPSTTYVVSVKSYTDLSNRFSDSSNEMEFTTAASYDTLLLAIIVGLSILAVIITGTIYGCYVKFKTKWWDTVASPKLLMYPNQQESLKPETPVMSSIFVEPLISDDSKSWLKEFLTDGSGSPQHSSGISTGSSCLSYANTEPPDIVAGVQDALCKAFPNISPILPWNSGQLSDSDKDTGLLSVSFNPCDVKAHNMSSGSSGFDNKTYSILIPGCPQEVDTDSSEVQTLLCDPGYHPSEGGTMICADQQALPCLLLSLPLVGSTLVPTDMSYQQCNADSAYAEDSSLSSVSSGSNAIASCDLVSRVEAGCESSDEVGDNEEAIVCDENPCYGCAPAGFQGSPPVDDDYQAFQNLVGQPDVLFPEQRSGEQEEHLEKRPEESFGKVPLVIPGFFNNVQVGQCLSQLQRPLLSLTSAHQSVPVMTECGYQSV